MFWRAACYLPAVCGIREETPECLDRDYPEKCLRLFVPQRMVRDYESGVAIEEPYRRPVSTAGVTP
jgi:hypothetical protein